MPEYAPHGNYEIALDPDHERVVRIRASGAINLEMLQLHNDRTNAIVADFHGRPYAMVCDMNGGMMMTPDAEAAWIKSAQQRVLRGWVAVAYHFDGTADYKSLVRNQVTRVFDTIGVPWHEAESHAEAMAWVLDRLSSSAADGSGE